MIERLIKEIKSIILSENIILNYSHISAKNNIVNLNRYHPELLKNDNDFCKNNLGDFLSELIVEYMLNKENYSLDKTVIGKRHLYAVGSILLMGYQDAAVWGSGFPFEPSFFRGFLHRFPFRKLDIRCVRGPYTKRTIEKLGHKCPTNFGDPAVLMPLIYTPEIEDRKKLEYVIIPHYSTEKSLSECIPRDNIVSMKTDDYKYVISKITSAKKVISSSLHGIILAEAYGVPAVFYQDRPERFNYKYADWYLSTGRPDFKVFENIEEALKCDINFVPDLSEMRRMLLNTFPYDIWN